MHPPVDAIDVSQLAGWASLPKDLQQSFLAARIPASFLRYRNAWEFVLGPDFADIDAPGQGRLLRFGRTTSGPFDASEGFDGDVCLDTATGAVFVLVADYEPRIRNFVSSSLDLMTRTMRLVGEFEGTIAKTGDFDRCWSMGREILFEIERIDPPSAVSGTYWNQLAYEIGQGYFRL